MFKMTERAKQTVNYTVTAVSGVGVGVVLTAFIALRPFAGLPERVTDLETRFNQHLMESGKGFERIAAMEATLKSIEGQLERIDRKLP